MIEGKNELILSLAAGHGEHLRRFLRSRVRNPADIPDLVQEVYLRLLRVPDHETIRAPEVYIYTVAHHVAQQHALHQSSEPPALDLDQVLSFDQVLSDLSGENELDPALEVNAQQSIEKLACALDQLSPKVQATFLFHRRDGMTMEEIGARLSISVPMAKKYLARALVYFRKRLREAE